MTNFYISFWMIQYHSVYCSQIQYQSGYLSAINHYRYILWDTISICIFVALYIYSIKIFTPPYICCEIQYQSEYLFAWIVFLPVAQCVLNLFSLLLSKVLPGEVQWPIKETPLGIPYSQVQVLNWFITGFDIRVKTNFRVAKRMGKGWPGLKLNQGRFRSCGLWGNYLVSPPPPSLFLGPRPI